MTYDNIGCIIFIGGDYIMSTVTINSTIILGLFFVLFVLILLFLFKKFIKHLELKEKIIGIFIIAVVAIAISASICKIISFLL